MLAESGISAVASLCEATLRRNWHEGTRPGDQAHFAYTSPSRHHYPWQWYWDSCFTAISWRHFQPERGRAELESLLAAQREDGFIGHTIFWDRPLRGPRRFTYNVIDSEPQMTASIQPPALAWAWRIAVGDPAGEPRIAAALARHHEWLDAHRNLAGDGLLWIVQPDESGLDASPQFDPIWRRQTHSMPGFVALVHRNRRLRYDLDAVVAAGGPVCCEILTNVIYSLSRQVLGQPSLTDVLLARFYDERTGLFWPLARPEPGGPIPLTWTALAPLALPDLPEQIGRRLVEEYLLDPDKFWLPVAPPSVAADDPKFERNDVLVPGTTIRRYWRGPTWLNAAWLVWLGLVRLGYREQAEILTARLAAAVRAGGLREYYDPYTSRGMGAKGFSWTSLIMELLRPDPLAVGSYLDDARALAA